ncbi:hypothetical protein BH09BAC5_BH09BAC5_11040 [soil metagenome]
MRFTNLLKYFFIASGILIAGSLFSQNLIPNPGFEEYKKIPISFCRTAKEFSATVKSWTMPNEATSDYFHAKCKANASTIKNNFAGFQNAEEGEAYVGIYCNMSNGMNYSEYLKTKLVKPLKAGQRYVIQFYVSLAEASEYAMDRFGVLFMKENYVQKNMFPIPFEATVESNDGFYYTDKKNWKQVRMSFVATGGEKYMIIGNFHKNGTIHLKKVPVNKKRYVKENGCYYFLDDFCLAPESEDGNCFCPLSARVDTSMVSGNDGKIDSLVIIPPPTEKAMVLDFVFFDTDKSVLKPESFPSLDSLAEWLDEERKYSITITGHTDNSGDEQKNLTLSENRAKAVADYLIKAGVNPDRIRFEGVGSSRPVTANETPEGRAKNRRVEYVLHH